MSRDSETVRESWLPYELLAEAGVSPQSSMKDLRAAKRYFTRQRRIAEVHQAFSTLQVVEGRLLTDFFLFRQTEVSL